MIKLMRALCVIFFAAIIGTSAFAEGGLSPLHRAAGNGDIAEVKRLIDGGADINAKVKFDLTPLYYAAREGQTETSTCPCQNGGGH